MASVTFPADLGGDGSTVTDDDNASTGLGNGGHRLRFVPALEQTVVMAQTAKTKASEAASSASAASTSESNAAGSASAAGTSETNAAASASAASTSADSASSDAASASTSASSADSDRIDAQAARDAAQTAAASAETDADRAEAAADGLLGRRTVLGMGDGSHDITDGDSGRHYRATPSDLAQMNLAADATLGVTVHAQLRGSGRVAFFAPGGTLRARGGNRHITEADGQITAVKTGASEWSLSGDLDAVVADQRQYRTSAGLAYELANGNTYQVSRIVPA